jgi:hypothetical protein
MEALNNTALPVLKAAIRIVEGCNQSNCSFQGVFNLNNASYLCYGTVLVDKFLSNPGPDPLDTHRCHQKMVGHLQVNMKSSKGNKRNGQSSFIQMNFTMTYKVF